MAKSCFALTLMHDSAAYACSCPLSDIQTRTKHYCLYCEKPSSDRRLLIPILHRPKTKESK